MSQRAQFSLISALSAANMHPRALPLCCASSTSFLLCSGVRRLHHAHIVLVTSAQVCSHRACTTATSSAPTAAASGFAKPRPATTSTLARTSSNFKASASSGMASPPPPPLSILSWAVDGSGHTHHHCTRRLTMAQRIPLLCATIRQAAPDVVALQDSTAELAAALTKTCEEGGEETGALKVYCLELAKDLQQPPPPQSQQSSSAANERLPAGKATVDETEKSAADAKHNVEEASAGSKTPACSYRLVGAAHNGRCGEVQLFVKSDSAWEASLLPGMGAGLTVELRSRSPHSDNGAQTALTEGGESIRADATKAQSTSPAQIEKDTAAAFHVHRCVLTALDLSYRGKSLGTHLHGLLSDAAVSAEGSPFTLQAPQPSSSAAHDTSSHISNSDMKDGAQRGGRAPGQLDAHRAVAFDWVHHHVRPDVLVGNVFMGARERVSGFDDAWVRAGSPGGQERTTNTCARHRVDHMTNYYYFCPSPGVASKAVTEKLLLRLEEEEDAADTQASAFATKTSAEVAEEGQAGQDVLLSEDTASTAPARSKGEDEHASSPAEAHKGIAVAADAPVGTPIPLDAFYDDVDGLWRVRRPSLMRSGTSKVDEAESAKASADDASSTSLAFADLTTGMPEVAGRFQRCFFRSWVRRGPSSRSGHLSAHPFIQLYRRCRVVVLRPMTEVTLSAEEQAWHTRYITALYSSPAGHKASARRRRGGGGGGGGGAPGLSLEGTPAAEVDESTEMKGRETAADAPLRLARVPTQVRCSLSDQYPLLTILS